MAVDSSDIEKLQLKNMTSGEMEAMEDLWKDKTCVIIFFRRWGCLYCRLWAQQVSTIATTLKNNNIRLIGVGVEELGVDEFKEGKFFDGDIYVDVDKSVYSKLSYKRYTWCGLVFYIVLKVARNIITKAKKPNVPWNLRGDYFQNGGCLIVEAGGKVLHSYRQVGAGESLSNEKILEVLDLPVKSGDTDVDADESEVSQAN